MAPETECAPSFRRSAHGAGPVAIYPSQHDCSPKQPSCATAKAAHKVKLRASDVQTTTPALALQLLDLMSSGNYLKHPLPYSAKNRLRLQRDLHDGDWPGAYTLTPSQPATAPRKPPLTCQECPPAGVSEPGRADEALNAKATTKRTMEDPGPELCRATLRASFPQTLREQKPNTRRHIGHIGAP